MKINIETLILVAVWKRPTIFQGCFTVTNKQHQKKIFYYRCECVFEKKLDILDSEFNPSDYIITNLYCEHREINLEHIDYKIEQALYLLQYSLYLAIKEMLMKSKMQYASIDEIAITRFSQQIQSIMFEKQVQISDNTLGFAVAVDFNPTEKNGKLAVKTLLALDN